MPPQTKAAVPKPAPQLLVRRMSRPFLPKLDALGSRGRMADGAP